MSEEKMYCLHGLSGETCPLCAQDRQGQDQLRAQFSDQVTTLNHRVEDTKDQQIQQLQIQLAQAQQERELWRKVFLHVQFRSHGPASGCSACVEVETLMQTLLQPPAGG